MSDSKEIDFLIVGAGLFGAVIAHLLHSIGKSCLVIDKRAHIGGNCFTEKKENIDIHVYGAHIFHTDNKKTWEFANSFGEFLPFINSPIAINNGVTYNLPFNMNTFYQLFGERRPDKVCAIIEKEKSIILSTPKNLEEKAISLVGTTVYHTLIKSYTEKQWGRKCTELPADIITRLPVRYTFDNNYFSDRYQGIPKDGYTHWIQNIMRGVPIITGVEFKEIRQNIHYKNMVYTGMIDEYYNYIYGPLEYRTLDFIQKIKSTDNFQGVAVCNFTDNTPYTRIIEHKHFNRTNESSYTVLSYEYSKEYDHTTKQIPFYPIGQKKNKQTYAQYQSLSLQESNVFFGGRLGSYRYLDMDDTIEEAFLLFEKLKHL